MVERFPNEFVTWHHKTPIGVKVDEVFGMDVKTGKVWREMARQIYSEQGGDNYRIIDHFENGAPFLENYPGRISITHTNNFFAVASLPKTPELSLNGFSLRTAMGIDAEPLDREQVIKVRSKFLSEEELTLIPEKDLIKNVQAWTAKEALYKAAFTSGVDFKNDIKLIKLPSISANPEKQEISDLGDAVILFPGNSEIKHLEMKLYSYESYGCCVTIAISNKAARFGA